MTVRDALEGGGIAHADAEVLLAAILGKDRAWLLAHPEQEIPKEIAERFGAWADRRKRQEPVAYIIGNKEFYGRNFAVDSRVLIPRPSTEGFVTLALDFLRSGKDEVRDIDCGIIAMTLGKEGVSECTTVADIGTGSGCIAVTLACERPDLHIIATDIRDDILALAGKNAAHHGAGDRIEFRRGDGIDPVRDLKEPFIIVSNPPYIPEGRKLMKDVVDYEPHEALFAGKDGLAVLLPLVRAAKEHPRCRGIVLECGQEQEDVLRAA